MHEISIAQSLVDEVLVQLDDGNDGAPSHVVRVTLRVGVMSGVVPEALRFAFGAVTHGTPLDGARLEIDVVGLVAWCDGCGAERALAGPQRLRCPTCAAPTPRVLRGRELELVSIEVVDGAATADP
jgi:hydrogenase nickel incorporation protein HypA/HybF